MSKAAALVLVLVLMLVILPTVAFAANGNKDSRVDSSFNISLGEVLDTTQVTIDANNGTGTTCTIDVPIDSGYKLPERSSYNDGEQILVSWNTCSDGSGDSYEPGQTVIISAPMTFYAIRLVVHVTEVSLSDQMLLITMGDAPVQLTAIVTPDYTSYPGVIWASSDSDVATVDQTGLVTPQKGGSVSITATADGITETCAVTIVQPVNGISVDKSSISMMVGAMDKLTATVNPGDATDKTITWASDNPSIASVDQTGQITAKAPGRAVITTSAGSCSATCEVFVSPIMLSLQLAVNEKIFLYAAMACGSPTSVWKSSNSAVATVDNTGLVNAVMEGNAVITVIADGVSQSVGIYVCPPSFVAAPSSVKAVRASSGSVKVTWATVPNASVYEVWRAATESGTYTKIASVSDTKYTETGLAAGSTCYYQIKACYFGSVNVYSDCSPVISAGPMPVTPGTVKATAASVSSVSITWGNSPGAVGYEVWRAASVSGSCYMLAAVSTTSYTNLNVAAGTTWYYTVRARYSGISDVYSGFTSIVCAGPLLPAPDSAEAVRASDASVRATWGAVIGAAKYEVWRSATASGIYSCIATVDGTTYTDTGLAAGSNCFYKIRAYYVNQSNVYSEFTSPLSAGPMPVTPVAVKAVSASVSSVAISWGTAAGAACYEVWRATSALGKYSRIATVNTTGYTNTGIAAGTTCYYKVRACYTGLSDIYSDYSAIVSAGPLLAVPEPAKAVRETSTGIKVTWGTVAGAAKYEVWRAASASGIYSIITTVEGTSYSDKGLASGSTWYYKIRAYYTSTTKVCSEFTSAVSAGPMPVTPGFVKAVSASFSSIALSWVKSAGAASYEVWRAPSASGTYSRIATVTTNGCTNTSLTAGSAYYYKIRACYSGITPVYSSFSDFVSAKPVPAAPASIKTVRASATSIVVTWGSIAGATNYEVWRASSSSGIYAMAGGTSSASFTDNGLKSGTTYYYKVRAYCLVCNAKVYSAFSTVLTAKP